MAVNFMDLYSIVGTIRPVYSHSIVAGGLVVRS